MSNKSKADEMSNVEYLQDAQDDTDVKIHKHVNM